jgi:hypothetical protein
MKLFTQHYQNYKDECKMNNKSYKVGEKMPAKTSVSYKEWDSVIILLPCDKARYPLSDLSTVQKQFQSKYRNIFFLLI